MALIWFPYPGCPVRHSCPVLVVIFWPYCSTSQVWLSQLSCSACPVLVALLAVKDLAILFWLSCPDHIDLPPRFWISYSGCPSLVALFWLYHFGCPGLVVMYIVSCSDATVPAVLFRLSCSGVLTLLSCSACHILPVLHLLYRTVLLKGTHAHDFHNLFLNFFWIFQSLIDTKRSRARIFKNIL